jgi:hypothetical protein
MKSKLIVLIEVGGILVCALLFIRSRNSNETESATPVLVQAAPNSSSEQKKDAAIVPFPGIQTSISSLGDRKFAVREAASKRLIGFGMGAIPELQKAQRSRDAEIRRRSREIIQEIERLNNVVNGAEFRVITEPVWLIPKPGEETRIKIGLEFKNRSKEKVVFYLDPFEAIRPILTSSNGQTIRIEGGRDGTPKRSVWSPCLDPEESYEFLYPDTRLSWANQGKELRLYLITNRRECLYFPERGVGGAPPVSTLSPGNYSISFHYEHTGTLSPVQGVSPWIGEATTPPVKVEIK